MEDVCKGKYFQPKKGYDNIQNLENRLFLLHFTEKIPAIWHKADRFDITCYHWKCHSGIIPSIRMSVIATECNIPGRNMLSMWHKLGCFTKLHEVKFRNKDEGDAVIECWTTMSLRHF